MQFPSVFPVTCHTDFVGPRSTFVVIRGFHQDGSQFIPLALRKGATALVVETDHDITPYESQIKEYHAQIVRVPDTRKALAALSEKAAGFPANQLQCIGVTGTKGKTITSWLCAHMLKTAGYSVALMSTVANFIGDTKLSAPLTTPQPDYLQQFLKVCIEQNVTHVVMEVAAQALTMHRLEGISFDAIAFTNFGLEHLEFYDSMGHYFDAKMQLLEKRKPGTPAFINGDDPKLKNITKKNSFFYTIQEADFEKPPSLAGKFNTYNIIAARHLARAMGASEKAIQKAIEAFPGIPGRMETYHLTNGARAIIDYAHNPLSYEALLSYLRTQTDHLIVVFGAGGRRDPSRRPLMGKAAGSYADLIVLTSDNPRDEDPRSIITDIQSGISSAVAVHHEIDRAVAIAYACNKSKKGSIVAILGKGPDEYQIIGTERLPFSERAILAPLSQ